jgi:hypothetical protein
MHADIWRYGRWVEKWTVHCEFCAHPDLFSEGALSFFPGIKRPERVAGHSLLRGAEIMNEWFYASNPLAPLWFDGQNFTFVTNRGRYYLKTALAIFWLGLCIICTVNLGVVKVKIQTWLFARTNHIYYHLYHLFFWWHLDIWLTVWIAVLGLVRSVYLLLKKLYFRRLLQESIFHCSPATMRHAS